jgi:hypothetical protein
MIFDAKLYRKETTRKIRTYVEDNIKTDLGEVGLASMGSSNLAWDGDQCIVIISMAVKLRALCNA